MNFSKKIISFILVLILVSSVNIDVFSKEINEIKESSIAATVIQVLDGDTIKVQISGSNNIAYVKLKGVDSKGFDDAFEYLTNELLGQKVVLIKDGLSYKGGKLNYMNVLFNGKNMSRELLINGLALIDKTQSSSNYLLAYENIAKGELLGMWSYTSDTYSSITGEGVGSNVYTSDRVNINTASRNQLQKLLKGVSSDLAREIIRYREKNPFSNIQEIKFVKGFTKKIFEDNKRILTVSTNINKASEFELRTLDELSDDKIRKILDKRSDREFSSVYELRDILTKQEYDKIYQYVSIKDEISIYDNMGYSVANINGSSRNYLTGVGLTYSMADDIINSRKNGYTYKTLMELTKLNGKHIFEENVHFFEDNLNTFIDLNTNNRNELDSLFGWATGKKVYDKTFKSVEELKSIITLSEYDRVKNIVYIDKLNHQYININTATKEQMQNENLNIDEINKIINKRPITNSDQLPFNVSHITNKISLYTNINTASEKELKSLNNGISNSLISKIIEYRKNDNFGSLDEVYELFKINGASSVYYKIKDFIVIR